MKKALAFSVSASLLFSLFGGLTASAQTRPSTLSLGQLGCQATRSALGGFGNFRGYTPLNEDFPMGFEVFRAVGRLGASVGNGGILRAESAQIACRLAAPGETPRFKTLTLAFGLPEQGGRIIWVRGSTARVRLTVYLDGKSVGSKTLYLDDVEYWPIDISGARSVGMTAECFNQKPYNCPPIIFFQDTLEN